MTTPASMLDISAVQNGNMETLHSLASTLLQAGYKITLLNLELARNTLNQGAQSLQPMLSAETAARAEALPYPALTREGAAYLKNLAHISAETQVEIARLLQSHTSEFGKRLFTLVDRAMKTDGQFGNSIAAAAMKSMVATATASCANLTETARRVSEMAEANALALAETVQSMNAAAQMPALPRHYKKAA